MPFIDRILYVVRRMESKNQYDRGTLTYIGELADEINCYNDVLAEWIRMNRGELELTIESFHYKTYSSYWIRASIISNAKVLTF